MKSGTQVSPDYMVATFLQGEIDSPRNGAAIHRELANLGEWRRLVDRPNLRAVTDRCRSPTGETRRVSVGQWTET
jgi:hypothetical protein